jgi:hypothetical protein
LKGRDGEPDDRARPVRRLQCDVLLRTGAAAHPPTSPYSPRPGRRRVGH